MDKLIFLILLFASLQSCNTKKKSPDLIELQPKSKKRKKRLITSSEGAVKLLESLKIKYTDKGQRFDNNGKLIWIENKYPT